MTPLPIVSVLGGTGALGHGLAWRWANAGLTVLIGSRSRERASSAAAEFGAGLSVEGMSNVEAAEKADISVLAVPYSHQQAMLEEIGDVLVGKILVTTVVPLVPPKVSTAQLPAAGCAALEARAVLPEGVMVVSAFQNVAAAKLRQFGPIDCDILVTGDSKEARARVVDLVEKAGMRGIEAGVLANSAAAEALTSTLIAINRRYKIPGAGIRISGLDEIS